MIRQILWYTRGMKHHPRGFSVRGLVQSFKNAARGFRVLLWNEYNLYLQILAAVGITILGFAVELTWYEWALQSAVIGLVIFSELINTAIEKTMDLVHPEYDDRVRDIKDLAAGSVLFIVLVSLTTGAFIYLPKFF